jgi:hypothetical protein
MKGTVTGVLIGVLLLLAAGSIAWATPGAE